MNASQNPSTATPDCPRRRRRDAPAAALRPLALAAAALLAAAPARAEGPAGALPGGLQVVLGQASAVVSGNRLTVTNSANAILNWQQFSIAAGNAVRFEQPGAASQVLNRVVGADPSAILGSLSSNGHVWLINPRGVLFGADARIDVAGLVASTLNISDAHWQARRYSLLADTAPGLADARVVNQGELRTAAGGRLMLIGTAGVRNEGLVSAPGGQVLLAAGHSVDLVDSALPHLTVRLTAPQGEVLNLGRVLGDGGHVDLQAAIVNQQGLVRADGLAGGRGGSVVLTGSSAVTLGAASLTSANGSAGGTVSVDSGGGSTLVAGGVSATGQAAGGGTVALLGRQVGLLDGAGVDVSGRSGGGDAWLGGGLQGRDAGLRNAEALYVAAGASVRADALDVGRGGRIVLWSKRATRVYGSLSARGGAQGGDGGFIETSGGWLDARPMSLRTDAAAGRAGQWLLDPDDVYITSGDHPDTGFGGGPVFTSSADPSRLNTRTIEAALNAGSHVTVSTGQGGESEGNIAVVNAVLKPAPSSAVSLTLNAHHNITIDFSTLRSDGAPLTIHLNANVGQGANGGAVALRSSTISTRDGDIAIDGAVQGSGNNLRDGVLLAASALNAGSGRITVTGRSIGSSGETSGVAVVDGSTLAAADITLRGRVQSDANAARTGVKLAGGPVVAGHSLVVDGSADSAVHRALSPITGVDILGELRVGSEGGAPGAALSVNGRMSDGQRPFGGPEPALPRFAVGLRGASAKITAAGGASVDIAGEAESPNDDLAVYAVGGLPAFIDARQASTLRLGGSGGLRLSGEVLAPDGGLLQMVAQGTLTIDAAQFGGNPAQVLIEGSSVVIGASGDPTRLAFGSQTAVSLRGQGVQIGVHEMADQVGEAVAGGQRHALASASPSQEPVPATTTLASGGPITIAANGLLIGRDTTVHSTAAGNAITLTGFEAGAALQHWLNQSGRSGLNAPNGRWLVYAFEPAGGQSLFDPGGLLPDFRQYDARPGSSTPAQAGNGFQFAAAPVIGLAGAYRRVYDGSDAADPTAGGAALTGLLGGDSLAGRLRFAGGGGAGSGKAIVLAAAGTGVVDADGAPVYGYRLDSQSLRGDISPRELTVAAVAAASKVYDGGVAATVDRVTLGGVLGADAVSASATGNFDDRNVGIGKPVIVSAFALAGADAGNYRLAAHAAATTASITPRSLVAGGAVAADKVYDGTTLATVSGALDLGGLVAGDLVSATAASGRFADRNVGTAKTVALSGFTLDGRDAGNYRIDSGSSTASITARPLQISAASGADKVYDGGTAALAASVALSGLIDGDAVVGLGSGRFADPNAGSGKVMTLANFALSGAGAGNYRLVDPGPVASTASITPATLRYVADPAQVSQGAVLPALGGRVTGFVAEETLSGATTGTLQFVSAVASSAAPGLYPIAGSGLSAANYRFEQAPGNATALTIEPAVVVAVAPLETTLARAPIAAVLLQSTATSAAVGRSLDVVQAIAPGGTGEGSTFTSLDLEHMSQESVAAVLAARDEYKKAVFAQALSRLEQSPGLADAPGCATAEQAAGGQCLMITPLSAGREISNARVVDRAALAAPAAPGSVAPAAVLAPAADGKALAAAATPTPAAPTPAPPAATAVAAAPAAAAPPDLAIDLPARRAVRSAALPQIERKIAVLIGIDLYSDARIPKLGNAVADARAVAASLETNLGYQTLVLANPTRATVFRTLNRLAAEVGPADSVVLYYAGHGELVEKTGQGYWQPSDADATRPETWISNADVGRMLRQLPASQLAMVSDSCFSGSLVSGDRIRGVQGASDANALLGRRAAVVMSSGGNEPVFDSGKNGHSPFAWSLMQSLEQVSGWKPGSALFEQVRFAVARQLPQRPQYGASVAGGHEAGADYLFERRQLEGLAR